MKKGKRLTSVHDEYEVRDRLSALMEHKPWVGLTAEEVGWLTANFIKSIETKLKEKNNG